jgi:recombination protein U
VEQWDKHRAGAIAGNFKGVEGVKLTEEEFAKLTNTEKPKKPKRKGNDANKGMGLEKLIEKACEQYEAQGIANIKKVSTPWTVIRKGPRIVNAFPTGQSTVDFMGDYEGRAICFEAKENMIKTSFPLSNFEEHQIEFIRKWKGIAFAIIHFKAHNRTFLINKSQLISAWDNARDGERKSIPYQWFEEQAREVKQGNGIILDYLGEVG